VAVCDRSNLFRVAWHFGAALSLAGLGGCVYPADDPTGLELSWRFFEANDVDGEDGRRVRTCTGARVDEVEVRIEDRGDPQRRGTFPFDCVDGYQTQTDFQTRASDVFVPLHPRDYDVDLVARGSGLAELVAEREVEVHDRGLTVELFELVPQTVDWPLTLTGLEDCEQLSIELLYADPAVALAHPPRNDEGEVLPTLYREALVTDRGLALFGETTACSGELAGEHRVEAVDRGVYRLEVSVDGRTCAIEIPLDGDTRTLLDLDRLPCDG
jgi:hypothetical protein